MINSKDKRLYDNDDNQYTVVDIIDRSTILYHHGPKEFVITRPLKLDSGGLINLSGLGVWWCWSYDDALRLIEYIKHNG